MELKSLGILLFAAFPAFCLSCVREEPESTLSPSTGYNMVLECTSDCEVSPIVYGSGDADTKAFRFDDNLTMMVLDRDCRSYTFSLNRHRVNDPAPDYLSFSGLVDNPSGTFRAIFPFPTDVPQYEQSDKIGYVIPSVQMVKSVPYDLSINPSGISFAAMFDYDGAQSTKVKLEPLGTLIRIKIETTKYSKIVIDAKGNPLVGSFTAQYRTSGWQLEGVSGQTESKVTVLPEGDYFQKGFYLISVFPSMLSNGFRIEMYDTPLEGADPAKIIDNTNSAALQRGTILNLGPVDKVDVKYRANEDNSVNSNKFDVVCHPRGDKLTAHGYPVAGQEFSIKLYCSRKMSSIIVGGKTALLQSQEPAVTSTNNQESDYFCYESAWFSESEPGPHLYEVTDTHGNDFGSVTIYVANNTLSPLETPVNGGRFFLTVRGDTKQILKFDNKDFSFHADVTSEASGNTVLQFDESKDNGDGYGDGWIISRTDNNGSPVYIMSQYYANVLYTTHNRAGIRHFGVWNAYKKNGRSYLVASGSQYMPQSCRVDIQQNMVLFYLEEALVGNSALELYEYNENIPENQ